MKILFVSSVTQTPSQKNLNHFQHVYHLSRTTDFSILASKIAHFAAARSDTPIHRSRLKGKIGIFLGGITFVLRGRARDFDIVLTDPSLLGLIGWLFKLAGCRRWVVDVWDIPARYSQSHGLRKSLARACLRFIYRWADLFVVSILPQFELAEFDIPDQKMLICRNAIWLEDMLQPEPGESASATVLCMRSVYTRDMGLDTLAEAFSKIVDEFADIQLVLIGRIPGELEEQLVAVREMTCVSRIGRLEHDALQHKIAAATVCVVPFHDVADLRQTYPVKILEYMALGKPIIASAIAGMSAMINDGEDGILYRPGDAEDLAVKLRMVLRDPVLRDRLSARALDAAKANDCRRKNERIYDAMEQLA
jgi:glycosyltransferase involved in cell wall biosynthesis